MCEAAWPKIRIGDLGEVFTGRTPPTEHPAYFGDDYPFITPGDMHQGKYARATQRSVSHEGAELLKRIQVPANSVCVSCIGWQMGEVIMTDKPSFTNQQINTIVPDGKVEPSFLYYSLRPRKQELLSLGATTGVRTPILNKSAFCDLKVKIPPLPLQRRIAGILSGYDELIENNQRRIKILEEMARSLYREWFVNFRFPGHEKVPLIDSPLGPIPKAWEAKKLEALTSFLSRGLSPNYDDQGESLVINQKCIRDQRLNLEPARRQQKPIPKEKIIRFGDVLINSTGVGTLGRVAQVYDKFEHCTVDTHVTIVRSNETVDVDFFGLALLNKQETFERSGLGATGQTELSRAAIGQVQLAFPQESLQSHFGRLVHPMRSATIALSKQIQNLRCTRDLLLPRLLSGQVEPKARSFTGVI
jgi:type I restriction enzyme, S subunit